MTETGGDHRLSNTGPETGPAPAPQSAPQTAVLQWQCPHCKHSLSFRPVHRDVAELAAASHTKRQHGLELTAERFCWDAEDLAPQVV